MRDGRGSGVVRSEAGRFCPSGVSCSLVGKKLEVEDEVS